MLPEVEMKEPKEENPREKAAEANRLVFGVQMEVTYRLLENEKKKMDVLQRELYQQLSVKCIKEKQDIVEQLKSSIRRIQQQYDQLEREYNSAAMGVLKHSNHLMKSSRSQPAIGLKQMPKPRLI